jgi:hypothetical protein
MVMLGVIGKGQILSKSISILQICFQRSDRLMTHYGSSLPVNPSQLKVSAIVPQRMIPSSPST